MTTMAIIDRLRAAPEDGEWLLEVAEAAEVLFHLVDALPIRVSHPRRIGTHDLLHQAPGLDRLPQARLGQSSSVEAT
jgi:hypothetical protein